MDADRAGPLRAAQESLGLSVQRLWLDYVRLGGNLGPACIDDFLAGSCDMGDHEHDVLVQALNEHFMDEHGDHPLLYADELPPG